MKELIRLNKECAALVEKRKENADGKNETCMDAEVPATAEDTSQNGTGSLE